MVKLNVNDNRNFWNKLSNLVYVVENKLNKGIIGDSRNTFYNGIYDVLTDLVVSYEKVQKSIVEVDSRYIKLINILDSKDELEDMANVITSMSLSFENPNEIYDIRKNAVIDLTNDFN